MVTGYKVNASVRMTEKEYGKNDGAVSTDLLYLDYPSSTILEAFEAVKNDIKKLTNAQVTPAFSIVNRTLKTEMMVDQFMDVPSPKTIKAWEEGKVLLYLIEVTLRFVRVQEKRLSPKEFEQLKEKIMWDLETLNKLNGEEPAQEETTEETKEADKE